MSETPNGLSEITGRSLGVSGVWRPPVIAGPDASYPGHCYRAGIGDAMEAKMRHRAPRLPHQDWAMSFLIRASRFPGHPEGRRILIGWSSGRQNYLIVWKWATSRSPKMRNSAIRNAYTLYMQPRTRALTRQWRGPNRRPIPNAPRRYATYDMGRRRTAPRISQPKNGTAGRPSGPLKRFRYEPPTGDGVSHFRNRPVGR